MIAPAVYTSTVYVNAPSHRRRVALRQLVSDPVAAPAARLRAALSFYADEDNWTGDEDLDGRRFIRALDERGAKARRGQEAYYELAALFASTASNDAALAEIEDALDFYTDECRYAYDDYDLYPDVLTDNGEQAIRALAALDRLVDEGARYDDGEDR